MTWLTDGDPEAFAKAEEQRVANYEESLVTRILRHANVPFHKGALRREAQEETNEYAISFNFFNHKYPEFPVFMGAAKLRWMTKLKVGDLFGTHFMKLPCMKAYQDFCESTEFDPRRERLGLVFNWPGIDAGGTAMVLHNYPVDSIDEDPDGRLERGTRIVRPFGNPLVVYVIESFNDFLLSVGTDWAN